MYRVVIVDDEEPVLDSFAFILEKESADFTLCGKARSGTEAIRIISEEKPDLVFMDIQMPGIDGIEAITHLRQHFPEIVFILATAYERFDIAQRAIPLGVFSYLVKPISRKMLVNELHRVKAHLEQSRDNADVKLREIRFLQKTKEEIRNRFLEALPWGNPSTEDWEVFTRLFAIKGDRGSIRLLEIRNDLSEIARDEVYTRLQEKIQFKANCFCGRIAGRLALFVPEDQSLEKLDSCMSIATAELQPLEIATGKGGTYHYTRLGESFSEACHVLRANSTDRDRYRAEKEAMQCICTAFLRAEFDRGIQLFDDFCASIFRNDTFEVAKAKMVALFTLLLSEFDYQTVSNSPVELNPAEAIMALRSIEEWRQWSSEALKKLRAPLQRRNSEALPSHLAKALTIIREKFSEPIQLSSIADECQITPSYLCRLFNENLGTPFVEYLTRFRIEQAKILLRDRSLPVKEAANLVGFRDANYFSRIFRRYVGVSPSELLNKR
ncbi:MAG TPA: response regulator [Spirochaetia bacterium]|nr:response regulator [Spirochaetia bacterium]